MVLRHVSENVSECGPNKWSPNQVRVSVALTAGRNISPTSSNPRAECVTGDSGEDSEIIGSSSRRGQSRLEKLGARWQSFRGSSPRLA